jgi:predicted RND superfamily exporter protein
MSTLGPRLRALRTALNADGVSLKTLPRALRDRQVAADGAARIEVTPRHDMRDRGALARFVAAVRSVAPHATGGPVVIFEAGETVVAAFLQAAATSVVLIAILVVVLLRSIRDALLIFAPLVLAALLTVAATVVLDRPFNFANVIVLPLLFGLGVASGIHYVLRERDEAGYDGLLGTSTPRAVVYSALTTIGSFASIALSSHPGTSGMGVLLTIAITLTLICTLIVLPALMARFRKTAAGAPP